jgi:membrane-bound serine protease (ClpP class)
MKPLKAFFTFLTILSLLLPLSVIGSQRVKNQIDKTKNLKIYILEIKEEIALPVWRNMQKAFREANSLKADLIILHMNTYGGMVETADSMRTAVLNNPIPIWVYIDNNAASAGALISIACDSIYMRSGANMGAATVVDQTGKAMPDKYQSYMRSMMRSTAEVKGRDPKIAEAMVDPRISVPGLIDSTMVLTFTPTEAIKWGYCQGSAENIPELLAKVGIDKYTIIKQEITPLDKFINFLINPLVSGVLIMIIVAGIYFELQTPGIGFPSFAAIAAAVLYFAPLYLEGLAANWEILLFIIGLILLLLELFVIPGFGIAGFSGISLIITSMVLSLVENTGLSFSSSALTKLTESLMIVVSSAFISFSLSLYLSKRIFTSSQFGSRLALKTVMDKKEGFTTTDYRIHVQIGNTAFATTDLRPAGKIIINEEVFDAMSDGGFISKGTQISIIDYRNGQLIVRVKE